MKKGLEIPLTCEGGAEMKKDLLSEVFGSERTDSWSTPRVPLPRVPREKTGGGCYIFHGLSFKHSAIPK